MNDKFIYQLEVQLKGSNPEIWIPYGTTETNVKYLNLVRTILLGNPTILGVRISRWRVTFENFLNEVEITKYSLAD